MRKAEVKEVGDKNAPLKHYVIDSIRAQILV
jgi:hypothetical protein